ncbi:ATP-binding cassette domain-containing protein [Romboutsia sp.]|uniref:ATP-binding cassette domain-containing protein n=1 Tax=Romboutsia sp. TaxID=1965302 RepID=UPI002B8555F0|nr:ATP-binding cassette domain-containing protein [Romboutsia sp.]HSQ87581.1 ATP-binding cassette domain-containing protein [Romboutsia sp.]
MIVIENMIKEIKYQKPLKIDKLEFNQGHVYSILGHNGSGKSTLVKIIYNIIDFNRGIIDINDEGFSEDVIHKYIAYNPQKGNFLSGTLKENFEYLYKYSKNDNLLSKDELKKLLEEFKLDNRLDTNIRKLSGGEQAKAQFIRTLVLNKDFNMFDEPMANMDFETIKQVEKKLIQLKDKGKTVILITHDFMQAKRISDFIVFMENLNLIGKYKTEEFFNKFKF